MPGIIVGHRPTALAVGAGWGWSRLSFLFVHNIVLRHSISLSLFCHSYLSYSTSFLDSALSYTIFTVLLFLSLIGLTNSFVLHH